MPARDDGRDPAAVPPAGGGKACPSAPCIEGALLVGIKTESGLAYVQPPTRVDAAFVARAQEMGHPEARFRFSLPCVESACPQWTGRGCGVVDHVIEEEQAGDVDAPLPNCAIRSTCRWFAQRGRAACAVCPRVVADTGGTETYSSALRAAGG